MLADEEKARIRAEEIFRSAICQELDANKPRRSWRKRLWSLLNSSFALWFLSSVVVASVTAYYAKDQAARSERFRNAEIQRRLDTEIGNRLFQAIEGLKLDQQGVQQGASYPPTSIYNNVVYYLDNSFLKDPSSLRDFSIYPEFRDRGFRSLVFELNAVVNQSAKPGLTEALAGYEEFVNLASNRNGPSKNKEQQQRDSQTALAKSVELLNSRLMKARWRTTLER